MMSRRRHDLSGNARRTPVLSPLAAAVIAAIYPDASVLAQDEANIEDEETNLEEVVVTGSRIRRDTFSSDAPMDVVLTNSADVRGISDVAALLQTTTVAAGSPQVTPAISAASTQNGGLGTSTLSLRGLGANRTLVLLNGRRAGPSGVKGGVSAFDLNTIPLAAIDRVEILKDGASSVYGSDAVAGVVNIITSKQEGAEFDVFMGRPQESGGEEYRISGSWAKQFDRGYFRATADYNKREILQRGDRDYFKCDEHYIFDQETGERADLIDPRTGDYFCEGTTWGHVWVYDYAENFGDGTTNVAPPVFLLQYDYNGHLADWQVPQIEPAGDNPNWMSHPEGWYPTERGDVLTNSLTDSDHPIHDTTTLVPEADISTIMLEGDYALTETTSMYGEVLLNRRKTVDIGFRQIWSYLYTYDSAELGWPSDPLNAGWTGAQWLSPVAVTDHGDTEVTVDYQRFVTGLRGESVAFLEGWNWDVGFQYSRSDGEYLEDQVLDDALRTSYWRTGSCEGQMTPVSNIPCVDLRWLDPDFHYGNFTQEERDFLFQTEKGTTEYTQWSVEAFMSGNFIDLPAGPAALAVGFHYREDELTDTPGELTLAENTWFGDRNGITTGDDTTSAVFGELSVPLVADKPLFNRLEFTGSARYTDVESYGSDTTFKAGLNWGLTQDFRVRTTYGTSFRAPALFELFLSPTDSGGLSSREDPCLIWGDKLARGEITQRTADNCASEGIPPDHIVTLGADVISGGGAGVLEAETSDMLTAGIVWQPSFANLSMSIDYFDIDVRDQVDVIGARRIVNGCYDSSFFPDDPLCQLIDRNPRDDSNAFESFRLTAVRDSFVNVAQQRNRGIDVALRISQELPAGWGNLTVDTQHTYVIEDVVALFDETKEDLAGEAGRPEWVGNLNLTWQRDRWSLYWGMRFVGSTDNLESFGTDTVLSSTGEPVAIDMVAETTVYHNLSASREFDGGWLARVGVSNALNQRPPRVTNWGTGTEVRTLGATAFYSQYDWYGRRYFLSVNKAFGE